MYTPKKYFAGLSKQKAQTRKKEIKRFGKKSFKDPSAYIGFKTDKGVKTKTSNYTRKFQKLFPRAKTLKQKSQATGVPTWALRESYNRGMAAWRTGHRPGATQQQWGYARVHSLLTCGKTYRTTDSDIVRKATQSSSSARRWWKKECKGV
jgi:Family of unknown function (DUF5824)